MDKKYIIFDGTLQEGGAERVISILSKHLTDIGRRIEIVLYYDREIFYKIDDRIKITIVERETGTTSRIKNLLWLRRYFKKQNCTIISFLAVFNIYALIANVFLKNKIIVADRNDPRREPADKFMNRLRNYLYGKADGVVVQTANNQAYFSKKIQKKSVVIHNPIDLKEKKGIALIAEKEKKIVSVGRLIPQKNQELLLRAFAAVHAKYPEYRLCIYGEGESREALEKLSENLQISSHVDLPGTSKEVFEKIKTAELFVLPSYYEGMPNALLEAMCLGLPVISTKVSGATDVIEDRYNGRLVELNDLDGMIAAMDELLGDAALRAQYAREAVKLNEKLEVSRIVEQWETFIDQTENK